MPRLGPFKKGISILPKKDIQLGIGREGALLPETSKFSVYGKKRPTIAPKGGKGTTAKEGPLQALNLYLEGGGRRVISKIFARSYKTIRSGQHTYAVRIAGEKLYYTDENGNRRMNEASYGWLSETGQLTTAKDFRDSLIALDATTVGSGYGDNILTNFWDSLSMYEKVKIIDEFHDYDWADLWSEMYPSGLKDESPDVDRQFLKYNEVLEKIINALTK